MAIDLPQFFLVWDFPDLDYQFRDASCAKLAMCKFLRKGSQRISGINICQTVQIPLSNLENLRIKTDLRQVFF